MKLKVSLLLFCLILVLGYTCKKEKATPLSLLTSKKWKATKSTSTDPTKISLFNDCEIGDVYTFSENSLSIQQNQPNCSTRQFINPNFKYTLDFNSNTIKTENGTYYYITNLTADTLTIHQIGSYGTSTVKFQYIFIH